jgi:uncharacterized membrane protein HdeD (DUF308 family)
MTSFTKVRRESRSWGWLGGYGTFLILLGILAALHPFASDLALGLYLGWALILSGIVGMVAATRTLRERGHAVDALLGVLSILCGIGVLILPLTGALTILLVLTAWFGATGALRIVAGFRHRGERFPLLVSGILNILLFVLLLTNPTLINLLMLALLFACSLVMAGLMTVRTAVRLRRVGSRGLAM